MAKRNDFILTALQVISWIIFIGFCIQTGALLFNYIYSLFNPIATHDLYLGLDLSEIYNESIALYTGLFSFIITLSALKAFVFYLVIKLFRKLNLVKPFSEEVSKLISEISYNALSIGIISLIAHQFTKRLIQEGYEAGIVDKYWADSEAFLLMAAIVYVIAQIFKKGIELQNENDLTV